MISVTRAGHLAPYFQSTSSALTNGLKPVAAVAVAADKKITQPLPKAHTVQTLHKTCVSPLLGGLTFKTSNNVKTQVRFAHTDVEFPDFSDYRKKDTLDPTSSNKGSLDKRIGFRYLVFGGLATTGFYCAKTLALYPIFYMAPAADVLAVAQIEVNLNEIPEGKTVTFKWRGKPLFIRHRTDSEIATERAVPLQELRDPETDDQRAQNPKFLVVIGVCTHLGCIPIANAGDFGGYYCPCHGSHYDAAGRIRKGPAPLNLEVPAYKFLEENVILVG